jgi:hypothetical protein
LPYYSYCLRGVFASCRNCGRAYGASEMNFFLEVLIGGLLSGVMYALVALGFVMI